MFREWRRDVVSILDCGVRAWGVCDSCKAYIVL